MNVMYVYRKCVKNKKKDAQGRHGQILLIQPQKGYKNTNIKRKHVYIQKR